MALDLGSVQAVVLQVAMLEWILLLPVLAGAFQEAGAPAPKTAAAWAELGERELKRGEEGGPDAGAHFEAAEKALDEALSLAPEMASAIHTLSSVYMRTGRTEEAAAVLQRGLVSHPNAARLHAKLGYVLRYAGLLDESIVEYRLSQKLDASLDNLVDTERQIVKALIYSGRYRDARQAYDSILGWLKKLGEEPDEPDEKVQFYQGLGHLYAGEIDLAVERFDGAMRTVPDSLWSRFAEAYRCGATGDTERLLRLADELEGGNVSDGERRYRLAHLYAMAGLSEKALAHLEASARSGFFSFGYTAKDRLLASLHDAPEFTLILGFIEQRHRAFVERAE